MKHFIINIQIVDLETKDQTYKKRLSAKKSFNRPRNVRAGIGYKSGKILAKVFSPCNSRLNLTISTLKIKVNIPRF